MRSYDIFKLGQNQNFPVKKRKVAFGLISSALFLFTSTTVTAEVRISRDWSGHLKPDGTLVPDSLWEGALVDSAGVHAALKLNACPPTILGKAEREVPHKLFIDSVKYYFQPMLFMGKSRPDEICTPASFKNMPTYLCKEGQRNTQSVHIFIFNQTFEQVGYHNIFINQPWPMFCNAVIGVGAGDKKKNEVLVTVQYFPVEAKVAKKLSDIGSVWQRMTVLLQVSVENGKVNLKQDDRCLGNPNRIETIPDARLKLKQCNM